MWSWSAGLHWDVGRLADPGAGAGGEGGAARGGSVRVWAERAQRGLRNVMWFSLPSMRERWGDAPALAVARAAEDAVDRDRHVLRATRRSTPGSDVPATSRSRPRAAHDGIWAEALAACRELGAADAIAAALRRTRSPPAAPRPPSAAAPSTRTRPRCSPPGWPSASATGCARTGSRSTSPRRCTSLRDGARRGRGAHRRRQRSAPARRCWRSAARRTSPRGPLRDRLTIASSHIVLTEPVPDLLEEVGWTGGECITDSRALIDYFRTTPDGRIAVRLGRGADRDGRPLGWPGRARRRRGGRRPSPTCAIASQGSASAASPTPGAARSTPLRPTCRWSCRCAAAAPSPPPATPATASVPPTWSAGRSPRWPWTAATSTPACAFVDPSPPRVPPEPFQWIGAEAIRLGIMRKEEAELAGRDPDPISAALARIPELIGFHIGR